MSRIKGGDTKPEMLVRRECHRQGLRYRLHRKDLPGKPDLVFPKHKTVLFVHGCYWHSHDCKYGSVIPKTNTEFWQSKRLATVDRDERNVRDLEYSGWRVLTYWECEVRDATALTARIRRDFSSD
jgi:DNA mismatch endonuclease (patch repair protein)